MGSNCPKWTCQQPLERTVLRQTRSSAAVTTIVRVCCPRCGWQHDDYEIEKLAGKPRPDPWQKKPGCMRRSIARMTGAK